MEDFPYIAMLVFRGGIFSNKLNTLWPPGPPPEKSVFGPPKKPYLSNNHQTSTRTRPPWCWEGHPTYGWVARDFPRHPHTWQLDWLEVAAVMFPRVVGERWGCWKWACGFSGFRCCWSFFWIWDGGDEDTDRFIKSQNIRSNCNWT